jgi:RNA polymerase sigma factor (sigma-70 family)
MAIATPTKTKSPARLAPLPRGLRARAEAVLAGKYDYMDSPVFKKAGIENELFGEVLPELPQVTWYQPTREELGDKLQGTPKLMTVSEERLMFQRYNFAKRKLGLLQKRAKKLGLTRQLADDLVKWHGIFEHVREYLTRTNLALVLAMAKRTRLGDVDFAEVVSEGNMALLRAVDKFSVDRGFKFSTYACRAILKAFSRTALKHSKHRTRFPVEFEPDLEKSNWVETKRDQVERDLTDELKQIVDRNLAGLSDTEQTVIRQRFNWQQKEDSPLTLEEVGRIIGVTKERVRQIQNKALAKIRRLMEDDVLRRKEETTEKSSDVPLASVEMSGL